MNLRVFKKDIEYFVNKAKKYDCEINVSNHNKTSVVDASSIMGLFTLNLSDDSCYI